MPRWFGSAAFASLLALTFGAIVPAAAGDAKSADAAAIRDVIEHQLDAFQHDDGAAAFGFASPNLKQMFKTPENFLAMVRRAYQPVYRPKSHVFTELKDTDYGLAQLVAIVGPDGDDWLAVYTVAKAADGTWQITGCQLVKAAPAQA